MGERVKLKYIQLYKKSSDIVDQWSGTQALALALLGSCSSVLLRLPSLARKENFGPFQDTPQVVDAVRAKQMEALEATLQRLQQVLQSFQQYSNQLEKVVQDGRQLQQGLGEGGWGGAVRKGPVPALGECQEGLEDLWRMHRDEWLLKKALVSIVGWDTTEAEFGQVQALVGSQPNLDPSRIEALLDLTRQMATM
mmetsp:Transcript_19413/g.26854  ORF Transcript_19413/g.26854 Transcript_19413/m.26854 type:complete len:195 (-) Transcript_19413:600-1184(-)